MYNSHPFEDYPLASSAAILCTGGADVIRKEAWSFYRTRAGVRLCWELEKPNIPQGPKGRANRNPKAKNAFPAVLSTEGCIVDLCWEKL